MTPFQALLTDPDGGPAGTAVSAHFFANQLAIDAPGHGVDVAQLVVSVGGVDGPELFLNWLDAQGRQASLKPLTASDIAIVLREAPAALQPQLFLNWLDAQGRQASLKPLTASDIAIVLREAPAALQPQLRRRRHTRQRAFFRPAVGHRRARP